jgi:hypothetical protein
MDPATTTAIATIGGWMVGAVGTLVSTWVTQRYHDRRDLLAAQLARREALYSDFIGESARLLVEALEHDAVDPKTLIPVFALLSRIRLGSSKEVLQAAEQVVKGIIETFDKPNLTAEQIRSEALRTGGPLKAFSEICRSELASAQALF